MGSGRWLGRSYPRWQIISALVMWAALLLNQLHCKVQLVCGPSVRPPYSILPSLISCTELSLVLTYPAENCQTSLNDTATSPDCHEPHRVWAHSNLGQGGYMDSGPRRVESTTLLVGSSCRETSRLVSRVGMHERSNDWSRDRPFETHMDPSRYSAG